MLSGICILNICVRYGPMCRIYKYRVLQYVISTTSLSVIVRKKGMEDSTVFFLYDEVVSLIPNVSCAVCIIMCV
jgi:hypothetical protein